MIFSLFYFLITFLLEFLIVLLFLRKNFFEISSRVFLINLFTWPLANLAYGSGFNFYVVEFCVFVVEAILLMSLLEVKFVRALLISLVANLLTALVNLAFSLSFYGLLI